MWDLFQNGKTEYNDFYFIPIIATLLFLIAQSKLKYHFFPKYQHIIGTNGKYTKGFEHYSYICRCPVLSKQCRFRFANRLAERYITATELEINRFRPFPFGELVWHLITQVNDGILAA